MRTHKLAALLAVLLLAALAPGCNKLKARDQLNKGVQAFRNAQFAQSINHFQRAVSLDPSLINARLYLATAYAQQYVPGGDSPDNIKMGNQAIQAFEDVLKMDPKNTSALSSIAQIYYNMKDFDKAKSFQEQLLQIDPNNPDTYYWIGVLDYYPCLQNQMKMRRDLNLLSPKDPKHPDILPTLPEKARAALQDQNGALVDDGMKSLQKAIDLRPNYSDAMAYLNLMYRQKADLETESSAREDDLKQADDLVQKALAIRKQTAQSAKAGAS